MKSATGLDAAVVHNLVKQSIDFHCHGVGSFDFTEILKLNLDKIEAILAKRRQKSILTLYLPRPQFDDFLKLIEVFHQGRQAGKFKHIVGFGLEGPLLASHGGTPEKGVWIPTSAHWETLASCGQKGLIYVVYSPDAYLTGSNFSFNLSPPSIPWITETLLTGGVLPNPGHFVKTDPKASAEALQIVFDIIANWGHCPTTTDHLFNDMPHNFRHAWRTKRQRESREKDLQEVNLASWGLDSLEEKLGPVPAVMIQNARKGIVKLCMNFDGEHVDLAIVKKTVEMVGAENMLMMTDSVESGRLAGRSLHRQEDSTLLYQDEGIVAAGSQSVLRQIENLLLIGVTPKEVRQLVSIVPASILEKRELYIKGYINAKSTCI